jgi:hypothetical protein
MGWGMRKDFPSKTKDNGYPKDSVKTEKPVN